MPQYVRSAGGSIIMARRVYVDSTDDFVMWRAVDAIGAIANPRVLVVDDYPAGADALKLLLEQNGFDARTVNDASLACAVAEEWLPFAVVVDVVMPGVTGLELARRLRAGVLTRDMLLVAFTARASQNDRARAREAGFDVHCAKPLTPCRLLTVLESIVGR
jgi:CheY-like chemotaxis protein